MKPGDLVRFNHERDGGPVHRVVSIDADGMVELGDLSGFFAPHLFELANDIADIPPSTPHTELKLRTAAMTLRAFASGKAPVPENLRQVPFTALNAVADWLDPSLIASAPALSIPGYWMNEISGVLRPAIEAYLAKGGMTSAEIAAMRAYLRQWIAADGWFPSVGIKDLRQRVAHLNSREEIAAWLHDAESEGIDPL